ncbi:MAG: dienelactone hydrolase family protein [Bryobacteraceae bacterium]
MTIKDDAWTDIETSTGPMRTYLFHPVTPNRYPGVILFSEIFQKTGPIHRFAAMLAGHGYLVAVPEVYHELEKPGTVLAYDQAGADRGNADKYQKELSSYDEDAKALIAWLEGSDLCTGRIGVAGICLGGHLAFRAAMNPEIRAAACFYATDIHTGSLGKGKSDDSLARAKDIKGELLHIWGRQDPHVPLEGRNAIKARLDSIGVTFQWFEANGAHAFLRDEGYRYDPSLAGLCQAMMLDLFHRQLR